MSLQGQGNRAYMNYIKRSMSNTPVVEKPKMAGIMNRNIPVAEESTSEDYLMDQFKQIQKLRAGFKNG